MAIARIMNPTRANVILDGWDPYVIVHKQDKAAIWIMLLLPNLVIVCVILAGKVNSALNV